jgi:sulfate adenylyltransferase
LKKEVVHLPLWDLTQRQVWDIELLLNGEFSPLDGFLSRADLGSVCKKMRLQNGSLWPIPITLDVNEEFAASLSGTDHDAEPFALGDAHGRLDKRLHRYR